MIQITTSDFAQNQSEQRSESFSLREKLGGSTRLGMFSGRIRMFSPPDSEIDVTLCMPADKLDDSAPTGGMHRRRASACKILPLGVLVQITAVVGRVRTYVGKVVHPHSIKMCLSDGGMPPFRPNVSKALAQLRLTNHFSTAAKTSLMAVRIKLLLKFCDGIVMNLCLKKLLR